jgi:DNA (cytosine-5)-methyltransferase 1
MSPKADLPGELLRVGKDERDHHRELVLRHIDFLTELLVADHELRHWTPATGCPYSTPATVARKRKKQGSFSCVYSNVDRYGENNTPERRFSSPCICDDPISGSNDPLDAVAATCLGTKTDTIVERYVDRRWRSVINLLRENIGPWKEIHELSENDLTAAVENAKGGPVATERVERLYQLVEAVANDDRFNGVSLSGIPPRSYEHFQSLLNELPGISEQDGWWLLLTAFDKPVFPSDPDIDRLLCDLGLLSPQQIESQNRHKNLEDRLTDRQVPALHRALGGHAARNVAHFGSDDDELRKFSLTHRFRQQQSLPKNEEQPVAVDLFAGAGGISHGLLNAGYDIKLAVDHDRSATDSYRLNHPQIPHSRVKCMDIDQLLERADWPEMLSASPDIIVGGPPCQSLSVAGYRSRRADDSNYSIRDDPRTTLYSRYLQAVRDLRPKAIVLENVEGMASEIEDTDYRVVDQIIEDLEKNGPDQGPGYAVDFQTVDCSDYDIPQSRDRIIVFGVRRDLARDGASPNKFFEALDSRSDVDHSFSLKQGLSGLPRLSWDEGGDIVLGKSRGKPSNYVSENNINSGTEISFNHKAREHPMQKDRKLFELMDPGDTGWYMKYKKDGGRWSHLIEYEVGTEENPAFTDKYRMIHWDEPAPTVVAHLAKDANNYILPDYFEYANPDPKRAKPSQNRGVTPREAARLQSFPDDYIFLGPFTSQFRQIGNAVPPVLARYIGDVLKESVLSKSESHGQGMSSTQKTAFSDD